MEEKWVRMTKLHKHKENRYKDKGNISHMRVFSVMGIALCYTLLFAGIASATTVYVATDGSGDYNCDAIDDQIEINEAIDYIDSIGGGTVHLKRGTYIINNYVIMISNVVLEGEGSSSTIVKIRDETTMPASDLTYGDLLMIYNSNQITNIGIQYIQLDANKRGNPTHIPHSGVQTNCIWLDSTYSTYKNILLRDTSRDGIRLFGHYNDIIDCKGELIGHDAVRLTGSDYNNVINFAVGRDDAPGNNIVRLSACQYCVLDNIRGRGGDTAIQFQSSGYTDCNYNTIKNSILATDASCAEYGVLLSQADSGSLTGNKIINTIIYDTDMYGVYIDGAENTEIENCVIYNSGYGGSGMSGIKIARGSGTTVKNSIISNSGGYGINGDAESQYNDIWNNAYGNYHGTSAGTGDISIDPLFAYAANRDFHLKSTFGRWNGSAWAIDTVTSPCIDAGDPSSDYGNEPEPNGRRINMGAYGNTGEASMSSGGNHMPTAFIDSITPDPAEQGKDTVSFSGHGSDTDGSVVAYNWRSSIDGLLSTASSFSKSASGLSVGTHTIYFKVQDDNGAWSTEVTESLTIIEPTSPPPDLVAEWHLDAGSGQTAVDSSGNGNDGVLVNDPAWVNGKVGKGLSFDGTNDYVDCGHDTSLKITGAITVEAWVNWQDDGNHYFVTKLGGPGKRSYDLSGNDDGTVEFRVGGADCNIFKSSGSAPIPTGEWVYLVGTYEPSSYVRLFVNGDLAKESTTSIPASQGDNGLPWYIGAREGNQGWFNGIVDEVKIHNGALSAEEVSAAYEAYYPNNAPYAPDDPSPSDGAMDVSIDEALRWTGGDPDAEDTVTYDIYFGTSLNPPLVAESQPENTYNPGTLDHSTEYYWQIVATDNHGATTEGEVWSFVTDSALEPDLVAEWHLDEGSGLIAVDSAGNGNDGTLVNNPAWVDGKLGKALSLDGTNDYVDCGQGTSLKITGAITVEVWVNWQGTGNHYFVTKTGGPGHRSYDLSGNDDGTVEFRVGGADCNIFKSSGSAPIPTGEWVYLVGTYEPSSYVRLFVNGDLAKESTTSIPASQGDNGLPWYIGAREGNQGWFNGIVDEVKIHNGALSAEEVSAAYEAYYPNNAPYAPDDPSPSDGAMDVSIDEALRWTGGDPDAEDTVTYDIYFGTSLNPPLVAESQPENTYNPGTLDHSTEYYWQIVATDNHGATTEGEVWSFVTDSALEPDLVAEWHLDEGSGLIAVDSAGNGNDGTLVNNPAWVDGKLGKALSLDGTNDYVDCGQGTSLKITGAITVEVWVNWQGTGNHYFVTKTGGPGHRSYDLSGNDDGTVEFRVGGADCNIFKSSGTISIPTDEWVHIVGTYEPSSSVRLFVNGALAKESTTFIPAAQGDNGLPWYIGARGGNQGWFKGTIDEVKIYNRALTPEEVQADYEAGSTNQPPSSTNQPPTAIIDLIIPDPAEQGKETVSFTGHGTDIDGSVIAYKWSSSIDGQLSTASSFSKSASELSVGTHTIYFKVQDDDGAWSTEVTEDLTIIEQENLPPIADLKGPYTGTEGEQITFDGSAASDPDGSIVAYVWDFSDGNTATGVTPTHTYAQDGEYTVTLTVTDDEGTTDTDTTTATVADTEPTADFSVAPTSGPAPLTVTFTDNSVSSDGIVTWDWDFDNDGETDSTEQNPTQAYAEEGVYTVSLTVYEGDGGSDTMTKVDYIKVIKVNEPPISDSSGPYTGIEGVQIAYDGNGSYDLDGGIVAYEWDFGDGNTATGVTPTHTYAQDGEYIVTLTVTDDEGATVMDTTTATVADTEPTADFSASPTTSGPEPLTVTFTDNSASYDGIVEWKWDFDNDGVADSTEQNPTHVYIKYGRYTVSLTVTESDGDSGTMTKADYITVIIGKKSHRHTPAGVSHSSGATDVPVDED